MKSLFEPAIRTWQGWRGGSTPLPEIAAIPPERCEPAGSAGTVIRRDRMYFTVRLNEMHLAENRQWWAVYDPLVVITVGFNHGGARVTVPAIIGPDLIRRQSPEDQPRFGVVLRNVRVTGPHPYRGSDIDVSLAFYRLQRTDHARSLLNIVDGIASSLGAPGEMATALRFGGALLDGVGALLGLRDTEFLAGQRISLATSAVDPLTQQYCALVAPPAPAADALHVRTARLTTEAGAPYQESDFVLWSVTGQEQRGDENLLPFYPLKMQAIAAVFDGEDGVKRAKANLLAAYQQMRTSPDVTIAEAGLLFDAWLNEFEAEKQRLERTRAMPVQPHAPAPDAMAIELGDVVRRLRL